MKRYFVGSLAVALALISFAFTKAKDTIDCTLTLHYFKVAGNFTVCNDAANSLAFPIADNTANVVTTTKAAQPFGCQDRVTQICAIGYDDSEVALDPITNTWQLKAGKAKTDYRCCVKRTTNQ